MTPVGCNRSLPTGGKLDLPVAGQLIDSLDARRSR